MSNVRTLFKRELSSYFITPIAYVFIFVFLVLSSAFTFYLGQFFERGQADLTPFFNFHPWLSVPGARGIHAPLVGRA